MDSERKIINCFVGAAKDLEVDVPDNESICDVIGLGLIEAFTSLYPALSKAITNQLVERYREHFVGLDNTEMDFFPWSRYRGKSAERKWISYGGGHWQGAKGIAVCVTKLQFFGAIWLNSVRG